MFNNYKRLLDELAEPILAYETLFGNVKVHLLSRKLKELKKDIQAEWSTSIPFLVNAAS